MDDDSWKARHPIARNKAFTEGQNSHGRGEQIVVCPYTVGPLRDAWLDGYRDHRLHGDRVTEQQLPEGARA